MSTCGPCHDARPGSASAYAVDQVVADLVAVLVLRGLDAARTRLGGPRR